jgi:FAD/FMN-containing dehydrogenase
VTALKKALRRAVEGEVRFDPGSLAMYANDSSNFRQVPIGVVIPKTLDDVVATHRVCHQFGAPVLNRGGGTSLSGETVNYAVVIDHSKYLTRIGEVMARPDRRCRGARGRGARRCDRHREVAPGAGVSHRPFGSNIYMIPNGRRRYGPGRC